MSQRDGGVNRQHSLETGLSQAIRPMLICASESSVSVKNQQGSDQLSVPQTPESRMAKMKKKIISSPLMKRRNLSGGVTVMTNKTFGVSIDELLRRSEGCEVPPIIKNIVEYLTKHGMSHEGIFRISGNHKVVESLKASYDKVGEANLEEVGDIMAVAGLLKLFLRELPDPPIPQSMTADFIKIHQAHKDDRGGLSEMKTLLEKLPASNYQLLKYLCNFLVKVAMNEENNKMSSMALAIVFGPNFFRCGDGIEGLREQGQTNAIVCTFIEEFDILFEVSPYATTDIYRVQEVNANDSLTLLARKKHLQKAISEKNESSASDEESLHLTRQKEEEKIQEDGPSYAKVKKPKKMLHPSAHISSPTGDLDMYMRSVSPSWNTHQSDSSPTLESPKPPAGKEIVQKVINDTIKEHLFGPELTSTDENSPHSPESGDEGPPLPSRNYSEEDTGKQRRRRRRKDTNDTLANSSKGKMTVKEEVEELGTIESERQDNRQLEKENLDVKLLKKRPKSEGFEMFEKKGIVIGVDKNSNHILSSTYPQKRGSQEQFERFKDDKDLCDEIISTSTGDSLFMVKRNSEVLSSLTRDRAPPPKNRRRPSLMKRHETSEIFTSSEEELDKGIKQRQSKSLVHPLVDEAKSKDVVSTTPPRSPRSVRSSRIQSPSASTKQDLGEIDEVDSSPSRSRKDLITQHYKKKHHGAPIVPPLELYKLQQHDVADEIQLSPRERYERFGTDEALLSPRSRPLTIDTRTTGYECPPSPPHEQIEHSWFERRMESSPKGEQTVKQLTKSISQLKKKIRDFEDAFEDEHARRPSQSEKAPIKKYVSELGRARKQLKELKERAKYEAERLNETVPPMSGQGMKGSNSEPLLTTTPASIEHSLESLLDKLEEKREEAGRPEEVEQMEREQLQDEKLAVQKALLQHESLFGRPNTKKDKDLMRPLYDRYRTIKRKLAAPVTESPVKIPGGSRPRTSSIDRLVSDLAPIHEDALLHSPSGSGGSPARTLTQSLPITGRDSPRRRSTGNMSYTDTSDADDEALGDTIQDTLNLSDSAQLREDAKFHEMSRDELSEQLELKKKEKKKMRKKLKKFEDDFFEQIGRRVQREDRGEMENDYHEYKHIKHQLRLIEALLTKRQVTNTM